MVVVHRQIAAIKLSSIISALIIFASAVMPGWGHHAAAATQSVRADSLSSKMLSLAQAFASAYKDGAISDLQDTVFEGVSIVLLKTGIITGVSKSQLTKMLSEYAAEEIGAAWVSKEVKNVTSDMFLSGIVDVLANVVRDLYLNDPNVQDKFVATTKAAAAWVAIKQAYAFASSDGNSAKLVANEATLMLDVAVKDVEAFGTYINAKSDEKKAKLGRELFDVYAKYAIDFYSQSNAAIRFFLWLRMETELLNIQEKYDMPYFAYADDVITAIRSDILSFEAKQADSVILHSVTQPDDKPVGDSQVSQPQLPVYVECVGVACPTTAPTPVASTWAGQIVGAKGYSNGPNAGSVTAVGAITATGVTNGQTTDLTIVTQSGIGGTASGVAHIDGGYQYTAWGDWNGRIDGDGVNQSISNLTRGQWVVGLPTKDSPAVRQIGQATYSGNLKGDYIASNGTLYQNAIGGSMRMQVDFTGMTVDSYFHILRASDNSTIADTSVTGSQIYAVQTSGATYFGYNNTQSGANGAVTGVAGTFFGPKAEEAGGSWSYRSPSMENISGVFRAKR